MIIKYMLVGILLVQMCLCPVLTLADDRTELTIVADLWCPYNCRAGSDRPGLGIEIVEVVFARYGYKITYQTMSWNKAIASVEDGQIDAVVGAFKTDVPHFIFPKTPFAFSSNCFFNRKDYQWVYSGSGSLSETRLGVIKSYSYGQIVDGYVRENKNPEAVLVVSGEEPLDKLLNAIKDKKIDTLIDDSAVVDYALMDSSDDEWLVKGKCLPRTGVYIAFSPSSTESSRHLAHLFDQGMSELVDTALFSDIQARYGMNVTQ